MNNTPTIHSILYDIQTKLNSPKDLYNRHGGFKYRSAESILEAVKKILPKDCYINSSDDIKVINDRFYVASEVKLIYNDQSVSSKAYAREPLIQKGMNESQITGSASSYARKYALCGLFAIDDSKQDTDSYNTNDNTEYQSIHTDLKNLIKECNNKESLDNLIETDNFKNNIEILKSNNKLLFDDISKTFLIYKKRYDNQ